MISNKYKKHDLYVYELSPTILDSLRLLYFDNNLNQVSKPVQEKEEFAIPSDEQSINALKTKDVSTILHCNVCQINFDDRALQKLHYQTDFHTLNLKRKLKNLPIITVEDFERDRGRQESSKEKSSSEPDSDLNLIDEMEEDSSASDKDDETNDIYEESVRDISHRLEDLSTNEEDTILISHLNTKSAHIYFQSSLLPETEIFGIYKSLFDKTTISNPYETLKLWNTGSSEVGAISALFMVGGGHFAGAIVSHQRVNVGGNAKKQDVNFQEQAVLFLEHKTFHRYTTRRKQGGSQSAMDNAKGKANSAGSTLRRYNEAALKIDIENLLKDWEPYLAKCENIFLRARSAQDRRVFVESTCIKKEDPRLKNFPFTTSRPTVAELRRAWCELTYLKRLSKPEPLMTKVPLTENTSKKRQAQKEPVSTPQSKEEKHTEELISLLKKGRAPLLIAYLRKNKLDVNFHLEPESQYISTPSLLHYASQNGLKQMVMILLSNMKADPCIKNNIGRTAWDMTKDKKVKQAFQISRYNLGEKFTNWEESHIDRAVSREEVDKLNEEEENLAKQETSDIMKKELEAAKERQMKEKEAKRGVGRKLEPGAISIEQNLNSLTDEQRRRFMREQRARAAEARLQNNKGK